jgi:hypothetical protein
MNNKLSKSFNIVTHVFKHLKGLINRFQNFWKLNIFWNLLHKPWHNNITKIILKNWKKFEDFFKNILKNTPPKVVPKAGRCNSYYPICT